jgi:hypothetical protein
MRSHRWKSQSSLGRQGTWGEGGGSTGGPYPSLTPLFFTGDILLLNSLM